MPFETFVVLCCGTIFLAACVIAIIINLMDKVNNMKDACDNYKLSLGIQDRDKKELVELLGRVYMDCDQYNGRIMNDTRRKLNEWVNG